MSVTLWLPAVAPPCLPHLPGARQFGFRDVVPDFCLNFCHLHLKFRPRFPEEPEREGRAFSFAPTLIHHNLAARAGLLLQCGGGHTVTAKSTADPVLRFISRFIQPALCRVITINLCWRSNVRPALKDWTPEFISLVSSAVCTVPSNA